MKVEGIGVKPLIGNFQHVSNNDRLYSIFPPSIELQDLPFIVFGKVWLT